MAKVINLNQYRQRRELERSEVRDSGGPPSPLEFRPIRSLEELENLRCEIERIKSRRMKPEGNPDAG
ncbi:MAG: hypothetical protein ACE5EM_05410 [Sphingomonadales bacterium]